MLAEGREMSKYVNNFDSIDWGKVSGKKPDKKTKTAKCPLIEFILRNKYARNYI